MSEPAARVAGEEVAAPIALGDAFALLKPRVMSLVVFTGAVGLVIAPGGIHPIIAAVAVLCIAVGAGGSAAINMWYDRAIDAVMTRTRARPVPAGRVEPGAALGLGFSDMGRRRHGDASTLFFCDELFRLYGSGDYNEAMGASFAVENWAAAGFWKELIRGLERVRAEQVPALPLAFFTWHDKLEDNHRDHVWHELRRCYDSPSFDDAAFLAAGATEVQME